MEYVSITICKKDMGKNGRWSGAYIIYSISCTAQPLREEAVKNNETPTNNDDNTSILLWCMLTRERESNF